MKLCTRIRLVETHVDEQGILIVDKSEILDIGFVSDDHKFGADDEDVLILHVEGHVTNHSGHVS